MFQVINNACATQAILSVLMNIQDPSVTLGPTLQVNFWPYFNSLCFPHSSTGYLVQELKEFCGSFDAGMKGLTLSNSDQVEQLSMFDSWSPPYLVQTFHLDWIISNRYFSQPDQNCA